MEKERAVDLVGWLGDRRTLGRDQRPPHVRTSSTQMEDDLDMMETYDGSTESDDERLLAPLGDSYDALVSISFFP